MNCQVPEHSHLKKKFAQPILDALESCDLINRDIGITFTADHAKKDGSIAESAIDHVYVSSAINSMISTKKVFSAKKEIKKFITSLPL